MRIGLHNYRIWDMSWYSMWKLENQEIKWYSSIWVWRPEEQWSWWYNSQSKAKDWELVVQSKVWGGTDIRPRIWRPTNEELQCLRAADDECPRRQREWEREREREREFNLPLSFHSIQALNRLDDADPNLWGKNFLLSLLNQMHFLLETPSQTQPWVMFHELSGHF